MVDAFIPPAVSWLRPVTTHIFAVMRLGSSHSAVLAVHISNLWKNDRRNYISWYK